MARTLNQIIDHEKQAVVAQANKIAAETLRTIRQETPDQYPNIQKAAIRAWNEYQSTGRHVTMEAADHWLARLEAGDITEPPVLQLSDKDR